MYICFVDYKKVRKKTYRNIFNLKSADTVVFVIQSLLIILQVYSCIMVSFLCMCVCIPIILCCRGKNDIKPMV